MLEFEQNHIRITIRDNDTAVGGMITGLKVAAANAVEHFVNYCC